LYYFSVKCWLYIPLRLLLFLHSLLVHLHLSLPPPWTYFQRPLSTTFLLIKQDFLDPPGPFLHTLSSTVLNNHLVPIL
jgi:hypothetical protein